MAQALAAKGIAWLDDERIQGPEAFLGGAKEGASALMVLNRVPPRSASADSIAETIRGLGPLAEIRLFNRVAYGQSMGSGATVQEIAPGSKGAAEVEALGLEVLRHGVRRAA